LDEHDLLRRIADVEKAFESSGDLPRTVPPPCGWDISETEPTAVSSEDGSVGYVPQPLTVHVGARAVLPTAGGPVSTEPVFVALAVVRSLLNLVPDGPGGHTRMSECMAAVRQYGEKDLFPGGPGIIAGSDSVTPIGCPRSELNAFVVATRDTMLSLLNSVDIEPLVKRRLEGELRRPGDFLEPDDRGTFLGFVEPTGLTPEKQRNNARLDALAIFLHALRRDPYAVVVDALKVLRRVAVPPGLLSADPVRGRDLLALHGWECQPLG